MRSRQKIFGFIGAFLLSFAASGTAWAATYYVATNGSDNNAGTETSPFKTIAHAVDKMVAGDTTYVRGGTYYETRTIKFRKSGTGESSRIRLLNAPGETPKINFSQATDARILLSTSGQAKPIEGKPNVPVGWLTIEGFEITKGTVAFHFINAHDIVIRRNWIHHHYFSGIVGFGKNVLVDRNVVNRNGDFAGCSVGKLHAPNSGGSGTVCTHDQGIYTTGTNWTITNNLIYQNLAYGIQVAAYPYNPDKYGHADPSYSGASGWLIANNTIAYNNHRAGIVVWMGVANIRIINNILYENAQVDGGVQGIDFEGGGSGHVIENNLCYATAPGNTTCVDKDGAGRYTESGNIVNTVNPQFVNPESGTFVEGVKNLFLLNGTPNFQLQPSSPAIDKGKGVSEVTWDHAGGKRPFGAAFDIGAYEHGAPPDSGSPPPNPTGGDFPSGGMSFPIILRGPNGEVCYTGY